MKSHLFEQMLKEYLDAVFSYAPLKQDNTVDKARIVASGDTKLVARLKDIVIQNPDVYKKIVKVDPSTGELWQDALNKQIKDGKNISKKYYN